MSLSYPYCSVADVQRETREDKASLEPWYEECINLASRWVDDFCNVDFLYHDHSSTPLALDPDFIFDNVILLPWPVITLTSVTNDGIAYTAGTDYLSIVGEHKIEFAGNLPIDRITRPVKLTGTFGYAYDSADAVADTIPPRIRRATTLIAANFSVQNRREIVTPEGDSVQSVLDTRVPAEAKMMLKQKKRRFL